MGNVLVMGKAFRGCILELVVLSNANFRCGALMDHRRPVEREPRPSSDLGRSHFQTFNIDKLIASG